MYESTVKLFEELKPDYFNHRKFQEIINSDDTPSKKLENLSYELKLSKPDTRRWFTSELNTFKDCQKNVLSKAQNLFGITADVLQDKTLSFNDQLFQNIIGLQSENIGIHNAISNIDWFLTEDYDTKGLFEAKANKNDTPENKLIKEEYNKKLAELCSLNKTFDSKMEIAFKYRTKLCCDLTLNNTIDFVKEKLPLSEDEIANLEALKNVSFAEGDVESIENLISQVGFSGFGARTKDIYEEKALQEFNEKMETIKEIVVSKYEN